MTIPAHVRSALNISDDGLTAADFEAAVERFIEISRPWFLNIPEGCPALASILKNQLRFRAELVELERPAHEWKYVALTGGTWQCSVVCLPSDNKFRPLESLASDGLRDLARAWWTRADFLDEDPSQLPASLQGKAVVVSTPECNANVSDVALGLAGVIRKSAGSPPVPSWVANSSFVVGSSSLFLHERMLAGQLMQGALQETSSKWRFLNLYRIFECAYLLSARKQFDDEFFEDPRGAVESIKKALNSELSALFALIESHQLAQKFEAIRGTVDAEQNNRFLSAIRRSSSSAGWKQGAEYVYKIRCSIVHAGHDAPVFERFADATHATNVLLPLLEDAAFHLLRLSPQSAYVS